MSILRRFDAPDALALAARLRRREVSEAEVLDAALSDLESRNPALNAVITKMADEARATLARGLPDGPFRGVPFLVKDLGPPVAGVRYTGGSRFWRDFVPPHDGELVRRYREAGLVLIGKTNCSEYGLVPVTEPRRFGPTENPWRTGLTAGGSSGGSAAAVAARLVPMAHGNDGGGSIRVPAAACGVFGLKPTRARTPCGPQVSENWQGFAIDHALTLSVRDSAALLDASAGSEPTAPYCAPPLERPLREEVERESAPLRIALCTTPFLPATVHPDCLAAVHDAAALLESLGHHVEEAAPAVEPLQFARSFFVIVAGETAAGLKRAEVQLGRRARGTDHEPSTVLTAMLGRRYTAEQYALGIATLHDIDREVRRFMRRFDVLLTPTLGHPPRPHGALVAGGLEGFAQTLVARLGLSAALRLEALVHRASDRVYDFIPFSPLANVTGQPSMSVPLHWNADGLPIGVMATARFGDEATLFRLAGQLERARPWIERRPPGAWLES